MQVNKYHGPYEDNGAADPLRRGEERTPEPGDGVPGSVKVIAAGTAIGGRWGSIIVVV